MFRMVLALVGAVAFCTAAISAPVAQEAVEIPDGIQTHGVKRPADHSLELKTFPEPNEAATAGDGPAPEAVYRNGCIFRPGATVSFRLNARGTVLYRVVPERFFDVTMRVTYVNLRSFFVDRFFAGGAESIRIRGPARFWPVRVTIGGYRGSTGCFAFSATP